MWVCPVQGGGAGLDGNTHLVGSVSAEKCSAPCKEGSAAGLERKSLESGSDDPSWAVLSNPGWQEAGAGGGGGAEQV